MAQGVLDLIRRSEILGRIGTALDESSISRVFDTIVRLPLTAGAPATRACSIAAAISTIFARLLPGWAPGAFFDLP